MRTDLRIQAGSGNNQPLHRLVADDVRVNNFVHIGRCYSAIPDSFRIDHNVGTVFALVQAARFVGAYPAFNSTLGQLDLEQTLQLTLT